MKVKIDSKVLKKIPELKFFSELIQTQSIVENQKPLDPKSLTNSILSKQEVAEYKAFRKMVAGDVLLAVERLKSYSNPRDLPAPDPLTSLVIQASYHTNLPITVFSVDEFDSVMIRFASTGDVLKTKDGYIQIKPNSLIADTERGILGILGIKSSTLGKLSQNTREVVILSFGCSPATNKKSKKLVDQVIQYLQARHYISED